MNSNQAKLLLIISIFIIPFVISFFLLDDYAEDKKWQTTNYGKLLKPILLIADIDIKTSSGINSTNSLNGKWSLLYYLKNDCLNACEENIYLLRQVNTALGKDMNRLQRILMFDDNVKITLDLQKNYPGLIYIYNKPNNLHGLISNVSENQSSIFLVDPLGNVILKYDEKFEGKKLLKDIKKLLKLSRIG
tara:strand:+ start:219 stop:788 length:570 start_codon:yes stop_codon:yes gene_type:complete